MGRVSLLFAVGAEGILGDMEIKNRHYQVAGMFLCLAGAAAALMLHDTKYSIITLVGVASLTLGLRQNKTK